MTTRIGLALGSRAVRGVMTNGRHIVWRGEASIDEQTGPADAILALLRGAGAAARGRPAIAAFSPASVKVKRLSGLPPMTDAAVASQLLRANSRRFFLDGAAPIAAVAWHNGDAWWGAAFDASMVADVERACSEAGVRLEACVPSIAALAVLCPHGTVSTRDGDTCASIAVDAGNWRPVGRSEPADALIATIPELRLLGADAERLADAFAATRCAAHPPLALRTGISRASRVARGARRWLIAVFCVAAAVLAVAGRGIAANLRLHRDQQRIDALQATTNEWVPLARRLREASAALDRIALARGDQRSVVQLLAALTRALPESSAVVALRIDTAGGSMTLLSRSASAALARLAGVDAIAGTRVAGAVTRETVGGAEFQRVSLRFRLTQPPTARPAGR